MSIGRETLGLYYAPDSGGKNGGGDRRAEVLRSFLAAPDAFIHPYESRPLSDDDRQKLRTLRERLHAKRAEPGFVGVVDPIIARLDRLIGSSIDDLLAGLDGEESTSQPTNTAETLRTPEQVDAKLEELWERILSNVKPTNEMINKDFADEITRIVETKQYANTNERTSEIRKWKLKFKIWNAYLAGSSKQDSEWKMMWINVNASRTSVSPGLSVEEMREYIAYQDVRPIINFMEKCMKDRMHFPNGLSWDYASDGNPPLDQRQKGIPTILDLVKQGIESGEIHKDDGTRMAFKNSDAYAAFNLAIIGELRTKCFIPRYAQYLASPVGFDIQGVRDCAPGAVISYALRAYGKLPPDSLHTFLIMRFPKMGRIYTSIVDRINSRDKSNGKQFVECLPPDARIGGNGKPKKDVPSTATENDNVRDAIVARDLLQQMETCNDAVFNPVQMPEDFILTLPPIWDILTTDDYVGITYETYMDLSDAWKALQKHAEQVKPSVVGLESIEASVSTFISNLSKYKGIFGYFPEDTPRGERIRAFIAELFIHHLKRLFDSYCNLNVKFRRGPLDFFLPEDLFKKRLFLKKVKNATIKDAGTLELPIKERVLEVLEREEKNIIVNGLFSRQAGIPFSMVNPAKAERQRELVDKITAPLTDEEKKNV